MRRFPAKVFMAALAVVAGYALASLVSRVQEQGGQAQTAGTPAALETGADAGVEAGAEAPPGPVAAGAGDASILHVLDNLERWSMPFTAKIRQSVHLGDNLISGAGEYWQQGSGNLRHSALRLQSLEGEKTTTYEQVYTGKYLWTTRRVADKPEVTRVDVECLARELNLANDRLEMQSDVRAPSVLLARGGLSQLVAQLHRCFTFDAPLPARHGDKLVDVMVGRWRPEALEREWPEAAKGGAWPEHLPHHVLVAMGHDNQFPYFIEYRRGSQATLAESADALEPSLDPLARYEFFEVQFAVTMPEGVFEFRFNDVKWRDVTQGEINRLKAAMPAVAGNQLLLR